MLACTLLALCLEMGSDQGGTQHHLQKPRPQRWTHLSSSPRRREGWTQKYLIFGALGPRCCPQKTYKKTHAADALRQGRTYRKPDAAHASTKVVALRRARPTPDEMPRKDGHPYTSCGHASLPNDLLSATRVNEPQKKQSCVNGRSTGKGIRSAPHRPFDTLQYADSAAREPFCAASGSVHHWLSNNLHWHACGALQGPRFVLQKSNEATPLHRLGLAKNSLQKAKHKPNHCKEAKIALMQEPDMKSNTTETCGPRPRFALLGTR